MYNESKVKIKDFTDLDAWKESHQLVLMTYRATIKFPKEEIFNLISQMRRAAVSISSNIAEGFSRQSYKEKVQFYSISLGSTTELQNQFMVARDLSYTTQGEYEKIAEQSVKVHKIINGLIKKSRILIHDS
jgi:four helix bundle protein